jgi:hypothetical protein
MVVADGMPSSAPVPFTPIPLVTPTPAAGPRRVTTTDMGAYAMPPRFQGDNASSYGPTPPQGRFQRREAPAAPAPMPVMPAPVAASRAPAAPSSAPGGLGGLGGFGDVMQALGYSMMTGGHGDLTGRFPQAMEGIRAQRAQEAERARKEQAEMAERQALGMALVDSGVFGSMEEAGRYMASPDGLRVMMEARERARAEAAQAAARERAEGLMGGVFGGPGAPPAPAESGYVPLGGGYMAGEDAQPGEPAPAARPAPVAAGAAASVDGLRQARDNAVRALASPDLNDAQRESIKQFIDGIDRQIPAAAGPTDDVREYEFARAQGYDRTFTDYQREMSAAGNEGTTVNVNTGESDVFYRELDRQSAQMFGELVNQGVTSGITLERINTLDGLLANIETGAGASFRQIAANYGLRLGDDVGDIQAAQALINQIVPTQRPPGSGPMSDADLELFKQSVPRLINQPDGNRIIIETMRRLADYTRRQGEIAAAVNNRELTPADGRRMLYALENPLSGFTAATGLPTPSGRGPAPEISQDALDAELRRRGLIP